MDELASQRYNRAAAVVITGYPADQGTSYRPRYVLPQYLSIWFVNGGVPLSLTRPREGGETEGGSIRRGRRSTREPDGSHQMALWHGCGGRTLVSARIIEHPNGAPAP